MKMLTGYYNQRSREHLDDYVCPLTYYYMDILLHYFTNQDIVHFHLLNINNFMVSSL